MLAAVITALALGVGGPAHATADMKRCHMGMEMSGHGHDAAKNSDDKKSHHIMSDFEPEPVTDIKDILLTITNASSSAICPLNGGSRFSVCPHSEQYGQVGKGCCLKKCGETIPGQDGFLVFSNFNFLVSEINSASTLTNKGSFISGVSTASTRHDDPDPRPPRIS